MMKRDIDSLSNETFDVIIIGGGIHGAAAAWQCAELGIKVALIEKTDFGCATSANSLKIIHGGFRYLQHLNIKRMRESIISRRLMSQISPQNVHPLRCAIPNSGFFGLRSKILMRIALILNDIISLDRNIGLKKKSKIPSGKVLSLNKSKKLFPMIDWKGKTGSSIWYDAIASNSERLTLAFVQKAVQKGAVVANYLEMKELLLEDNKVKGVLGYDSVRDEKLVIKGKAVVFSGGSSNSRLLGRYQSKKDLQNSWAMAVNIVVKKELLKDTAIGLTGESQFMDQDAILKKKGRFFFFVPWRGYTMIGTTYTYDSNHSDVSVQQSDIEDIIREINTIFPRAELSTEDVSKVHAGLVPAYPDKTGDNEVQLLKETKISDLSSKYVNPIQGVFIINSVKYTTAPVVAFEAAQKVAKFLGLPYRKVLSPLYHKETKTGQKEALPDYKQKLDSRYGNMSSCVEQYFKNENEVICENPLLYSGEIDYFLEEEMAQTLSDVVFRRSEVGTAECPERNTLVQIAERMARYFDWDKGRIDREIRQVESAFYWKN